MEIADLLPSIPQEGIVVVEALCAFFFIVAFGRNLNIRRSNFFSRGEHELKQTESVDTYSNSEEEVVQSPQKKPRRHRQRHRKKRNSQRSSPPPETDEEMPCNVVEKTVETVICQPMLLLETISEGSGPSEETEESLIIDQSEVMEILKTPEKSKYNIVRTQRSLSSVSFVSKGSTVTNFDEMSPKHRILDFSSFVPEVNLDVSKLEKQNEKIEPQIEKKKRHRKRSKKKKTAENCPSPKEKPDTEEKDQKQIQFEEELTLHRLIQQKMENIARLRRENHERLLRARNFQAELMYRESLAYNYRNVNDFREPNSKRSSFSDEDDVNIDLSFLDAE